MLSETLVELPYTNALLRKRMN